MCGARCIFPVNFISRSDSSDPSTHGVTQGTSEAAIPMISSGWCQTRKHDIERLYMEVEYNVHPQKKWTNTKGKFLGNNYSIGCKPFLHIPCWENDGRGINFSSENGPSVSCVKTFSCGLVCLDRVIYNVRSLFQCGSSYHNRIRFLPSHHEETSDSSAEITRCDSP
uniref:Uncharacterized protein n=1 Tax=Cacopsylla melanoneura TaxID=428564 RepID=A0A8D8Z9K8_9HEMI